MPGAMPSVIRVLIHAYADDRHDPEHVYLGERARCARTCTARSRLGSRQPIEFAERIRRIPVYPAADGYALPGDVALLASNESPYPPMPRWSRRHAGAGGAQPLPRPDERRAARGAERPLRRAGPPDRDRQRLLRHPAGRRRGAARAGRRGRLRLAVVQRLPAPGGRVGRAGDRGAGRRRAPPRPRRDAARDHRRDAAGDRLQPEQPDVDGAAARGDRRRSSPRCRATSRDPRRGLHRVQPAPGPRRVARAARPATRTSSCCARSRRSTACAGCASATGCAARRSSARRSTRCASRSSATPPRRPRRDRGAQAPGRGRAPRGAQPRRAARARGRAARLGIEPAESQANFVWFDLPGDADEARGRARRSPSAACSCARARRSAAPARCASRSAPRPRTSASRGARRAAVTRRGPGGWPALPEACRTRWAGAPGTNAPVRDGRRSLLEAPPPRPPAVATYAFSYRAWRFS